MATQSDDGKVRFTELQENSVSRRDNRLGKMRSEGNTGRLVAFCLSSPIGDGTTPESVATWKHDRSPKRDTAASAAVVRQPQSGRVDVRDPCSQPATRHENTAEICLTPDDESRKGEKSLKADISAATPLHSPFSFLFYTISRVALWHHGERERVFPHPDAQSLTSS